MYVKGGMSKRVFLRVFPREYVLSYVKSACLEYDKSGMSNDMYLDNFQ